jgi:stearoyl-CoA desaturase (delta-9 desaturase)
VSATLVREGRSAPDPQRPGFDWVGGLPFLAMHLSPLAIVVTGFSGGDAVLAGALYLVRMFFITAGYHRYFSHRSYRLSRTAQLVMALGGVTAAQKGPLWWSSHHRRHHRYADTDRDVHSPVDGLWWSHMGWILSRQSKAVAWEMVPDFSEFAELRAIDRFQALGPPLVALGCLVFAGWGGVVAFCVSTLALWHATFAVNSVAHLVGQRRYATPDNSRNCWPVALLTLGEGWHNNHHHYPPAARQSHRWWELDLTWYALVALGALGVARELRRPPARALAARPAGKAALR